MIYILNFNDSDLTFNGLPHARCMIYKPKTQITFTHSCLDYKQKPRINFEHLSRVLEAKIEKENNKY